MLRMMSDESKRMCMILSDTVNRWMQGFSLAISSSPSLDSAVHIKRDVTEEEQHEETDEPAIKVAYIIHTE